MSPSRHQLAGPTRPVACAASVSSFSSSSAALCGLIVAAIGTSYDRDFRPRAVLHLLLDLGDCRVDLVWVVAQMVGICFFARDFSLELAEHFDLLARREQRIVRDLHRRGPGLVP